VRRERADLSLFPQGSSPASRSARGHWTRRCPSTHDRMLSRCSEARSLLLPPQAHHPSSPDSSCWALIMASATCSSAWCWQGVVDDGCHHEPHTPGTTRGIKGGNHLPLCCRVAHPWHAIRVTEAMRLRCIEAVRGPRHHAECPQAADAVIEVSRDIVARDGAMEGATGPVWPSRRIRLPCVVRCSYGRLSPRADCAHGDVGTQCTRTGTPRPPSSPYTEAPAGDP
jgi:hypothetical protein